MESDYKLGGIDNWASLVFVRVHSGGPFTEEQLKGWEKRENDRLIGYVFVIDPKFGHRAEYKLPGGHKQADETPLQTAVREMEGETNLVLNPESFRYVGKYLHWSEDHWKIIFCADIGERELGWMNNNHPQNEGEEPKFFTIEEFYALVRENKFMYEHYKKLDEFALILPGNRAKVA